jgi:hypothetical protein
LGGAVFLAAGLISYRAYAAAGLCSPCLISDIYIASDGWAWIGTGIDNNNGLACGVGNKEWMAANTNTAAGKAMLAVSQAALLSGRTVTLKGANTCTGPGGTVEVLATIWLLPP